MQPNYVILLLYDLIYSMFFIFFSGSQFFKMWNEGDDYWEISRVSSNTKNLDSTTGFGGEKGECSRRKAQHRGSKEAMKERQ